MTWLVVVSLLWAFSFGLIKGRLAGVDPNLVAFLRIGLALLTLLPAWRPRSVERAHVLPLLGIGALQFGVMYVLYLSSYRWLAAHEVALFTVLTPLYVVAADAVLERRLSLSGPIAAALACLACAVLAWTTRPTFSGGTGFLLLQGANGCFAVGQVLYRRRFPARAVGAHVGHFAWLYLGGALVTGLAALGFSLLSSEPVGWRLDGPQWLTVLYLGVLPSGVGFFLWNVGAAKVSPGVLAVMNNAKVPLGVLVSLVVFGEDADAVRLLLALAILGLGLGVASRPPRR